MKRKSTDRPATTAREATAKKKAATNKVSATTVRAVTAKGDVFLSNGVKTHCAIGKKGPVVTSGDTFEKIGDTWMPKK